MASALLVLAASAGPYSGRRFSVRVSGPAVPPAAAVVAKVVIGRASTAQCVCVQCVCVCVCMCACVEGDCVCACCVHFSEC